MKVVIDDPLLRVERIGKDIFRLTLLPSGVIIPADYCVKVGETINIRMPEMLGGVT